MNQPSKKLNILLAVSLALNVFFVGLWGGHWYAKKQHSGHFFNAIEQEYKKLPPELRKNREASFNEKRQKIKENRQKISEIRAQVHQEIKKETLDIPKIESLFKEMRKIRGQGMASAQEAMLETLKDMPHDARIKFAQKLEKRSKRKRR